MSLAVIGALVILLSIVALVFENRKLSKDLRNADLERMILEGEVELQKTLGSRDDLKGLQDESDRALEAYQSSLDRDDASTTPPDEPTPKG